MPPHTATTPQAHGLSLAPNGTLMDSFQIVSNPRCSSRLLVSLSLSVTVSTQLNGRGADGGMDAAMRTDGDEGGLAAVMHGMLEQGPRLCTADVLELVPGE